MKAVFMIARDSVRALLHRRLLLALMLVMLILTGLYSLTLGQMPGMTPQTSPPPAETTAVDERLKGAREGSSSAQEALEDARAAPDQAQPVPSRQRRQMIAALVLSGFHGITAFGATLVALFIGATALSSDVRSGTITMILCRPVKRWQFLLGKYGGAMVVLLAYSALSGAAFLFFTQAYDLDGVPALRYAPWLIFCQSLMHGSLALLLSMLMHPAIAGVLAFFISADYVTPFLSSDSPFHYLLFPFPTYTPFDVSGQVLSGTLIGFGDVAILTLYAFDLVAIFLLLAAWRFRTKAVV